MNCVVVTGASGFIGSSLVRTLIANGINVLAIDILFNDSFPKSDLITKIESGIDSTLVSKIPQKSYDALYHFAWKGVNGPDKADPNVQMDNTKMTLECAKICKQLSVKKMLVAGTIAEQSVNSLPNLDHVNGGMLYGVAKHVTHLMTEAYCKNIDLPLIWMQFSNIYGVGNKTGNLISYTLTELLSNRDACFGPALQPYDFIYIDDLIEAVYRLGALPVGEPLQQSYFIGSGTPRILKEYLYRVGEIEKCPNRIMLNVRPDDGIRYTMEMFDIEPLRKAIGDYVSITFDEGIVKTTNWLRSISKNVGNMA